MKWRKKLVNNILKLRLKIGMFMKPMLKNSLKQSKFVIT